MPPWVIASLDFQKHPRSLHIVGVRRDNRALFRRLSSIDDPAERGRVFDDYMNVKFYLHDWEAHESSARQSLKNCYLRFLRGWGIDSNSIEGAVLKGWVESRFGIRPTYHRGSVEAGARSYLPFARDRMLGHARTNAMDSQLDLVFEFCQSEARRRKISRLLLYRGTHDADQHRLGRRYGKRDYVVVLNNICSFSSDPERAWEFGTTVWQVEVPAQRICYFTGLVPRSVLRGEDEYLVLGGEHRVKELSV
ncbi:MAG TPA: NAD(+)--dinitrogen-reductase ADP-D-ribosyltransferase [Polyangiaceae bacterium]